MLTSNESVPLERRSSLRMGSWWFRPLSPCPHLLSIKLTRRLPFGYGLSPSGFRANRSNILSDNNKTFYLCLLYRGLQFNAMVVADSPGVENTFPDSCEQLGQRIKIQSPFLWATTSSAQRLVKKKYQCFTGNLMGKVSGKFVGQASI